MHASRSEAPDFESSCTRDGSVYAPLSAWPHSPRASLAPGSLRSHHQPMVREPRRNPGL